MPGFSDEMQALCDTIFGSKCARAAAVTDVKAQTDQLLKADRQFLQGVHDANRAMVEKCMADLAANCRERSEQVEAFRDRVRTEQRAAAEQQRQKLEQNQQERQEAVSAMLDGFHQVQTAFGDQCRAATRIWRELQQRQVGV
jgi:Skp family chaperone for outer membrane proteins